ncbi:thiamine pyrophosphate-binding protein [Leucobacter albus]|uniref:Thiamine pyrophosphate-binding protein n=1 Tax=Leucobacter albus TaxID=272210 RepID=A0ABW3TR87_9MICO
MSHSTQASPTPHAPHAESPEPTLATVTARALAEHASESFGLMGNGNAHLIDALTAAGVRYTAVRHEAATVAAADAYTRVSGRLAIATTTYGAGYTNALTALAEAVRARTPMLVVVGDAPASGPRPWDVDEELLGAAIGVRYVQLSVRDAPGAVARAAAAALRLRRPIVLALPYDLVTAPVPALTGGRGPETGPEFGTETSPETCPVAAAQAAQGAGTRSASDTADRIDPNDPAVVAELLRSVAHDPRPATEASHTPRSAPHAIAAASSVPGDDELEWAARALSRAARPLILAGRGAHLAGAGPALSELAGRLGALTATTALARGIFAEPRFDLGVAGGFGQPAAMTLLAEADVVLVVGAALNQFTMRFGELFGQGTTIIRVDIELVGAPTGPHALEHRLLQGDARATVLEISARVTRDEARGSATAPRAAAALPPAAGPNPVHPDTAVGPGGVWRDRVPGLEPGGELRVRDAGPAELCADGLLDPRRVAARLGELLPKNRHVTSDGGHFISWANSFWPVSAPERMVMVGTAYQSIGLGFCTVPGIAAAAPDSTVVVTTGDGGGLMALADLETAIRTARSQVIVVWNDSAYSAEVHLYGAMGLDTEPMLIPTANFAGIAAALGATGVVVTRVADLEALTEWVAAGATGTILLDCRVSGTVVAEYQREVQRANGLIVPHS